MHLGQVGFAVTQAEAALRDIDHLDGKYLDIHSTAIGEAVHAEVPTEPIPGETRGATAHSVTVEEDTLAIGRGCDDCSWCRCMTIVGSIHMVQAGVGPSSCVADGAVLHEQPYGVPVCGIPPGVLPLDVEIHHRILTRLVGPRDVDIGNEQVVGC